MQMFASETYRTAGAGDGTSGARREGYHKTFQRPLQLIYPLQTIMGLQAARALNRSSCIFAALIVVARAAPNAAFPFNSQVPTVARVNEPYSFQFSDSTFAPASASYVYSLASQPAWLLVDSATRTLSGTPGQADAGPINFSLTAADSTGAAHMDCTLVISTDPAPQPPSDIGKQLAATTNLSSSDPPIATLLPSTTFNFNFQQESFIDIVSRKLWYYATLADHTPLPSWLKFDSTTLTFTGTAPDLSAFPQSWTIELIASDVEGFAGTSASFTIAIGTQQLAFVPEEQILNITAGEQLSSFALGDTLFLNNELLDLQQLKSAVATDLPSWLKFDAATLELKGTVPRDVTTEDISISVTDQLGNTAVVQVNLVLSGDTDLFSGRTGSVTAHAGEHFSYSFEDTISSDQDVSLTVAFPPSATWLKYDSGAKTISGDVPSKVDSNTVQVTLQASSADDVQSQTLTIRIVGGEGSTTSSAIVTASTATTTSTPVLGVASARTGHRLRGGEIAAIVILSVIAAALLLAGLVWCLRRRRREARENKRPSTPTKNTISRPLAPPGSGGTIMVTTEVQRDVEKDADSAVDIPVASRKLEPPPQITLNLPTHTDESPNRRSKWSKRISRVSLVSSIGAGEDAIRADSNIPKWGENAKNLHTPHDSFSIPAELARISRRESHTSPTKKALKRLRDRQRSRDSAGLGVHASASGGIARHSSRNSSRNKHRRARSSFGGLSTTREASDVGSIRTTGTSVLSTKASEFPMPPSTPGHSMSLSVPTLSTAMSIFGADPKRKSIRMVERSDSTIDTRPLEEKRQSYIRHRASAVRNRVSTNVESPLFAHGSRAGSSSHSRQNGSRSANGSSSGSVRHSRTRTRSKNSKSMLTTYSESSSLEPHADDARRSAMKEQKRLSERLRSSFAPTFPRVMSRYSVTAEDAAADQDDDWTTSESTSSNGGNWKSNPEPSHSRLERISMNSDDWRAELAKPRNERSFVLPDSMSKAKAPRPDQVATRRPVSVEDVQRLSSMKAETDAATTAGSEGDWEDADEDTDEEEAVEAGLMARMERMARLGTPGRGMVRVMPFGNGNGNGTAASGRSDVSGPAFL
ncbi:Axial budding pattern protein 2 [Fulvia fulva]|uniref:Axial budding pattern protein 2 n=1 Tax=Passalora fulva TaxID=5499 RepID=A0A9Q8UWA1_PASFU|nr:Axial budding pattern protein 2 [Fulvia fulva]KAK4610557.1 Axial budding pattern protein 2 [Fulvia fulva]KAK4611352.1 Axial budding pattern protein 2 [Fulvia fulva]UJO24775.1 Axial budding pattern protein 2 [Fulvia fulva]WPV21971.1 Axial budding pattern protein 2 [Fulvia fulva]WPV37138.1 Axial budding pattern protein 2 [Fulvia fulva]